MKRLALPAPHSLGVVGLLAPLFLLVLLSACTLPMGRGGPTARRGTGSTASATSSKPVQTLAEIQALATKGDSEAMFNLGMIYLEGSGTGTGTVKKDSLKGRQWLERAAKAGFAKAQFNLGVMYYQGSDGVKQNLPKARDWFFEAAKGSDRLAEFNLGVMAYRGEGGRQSFEVARTYFERASVQGHGEGAYNLGVMYAKGEGVVRDTIEAIAWFTIAEAQGHKQAGEVADNLRSRMTPEEKKKANERSIGLAREIERKAQAL